MDTRWRPSVTVAAVIEREGRFLLVEEETSEGLKLNNPAGHLDPGESPADGCARETLEETAYDFRPTALVGLYLSRFQRPATGEDITYFRLAFCGELGAHDASRKLDHGIVRTLWLTPEEIRHDGAPPQPAAAALHGRLPRGRAAPPVGDPYRSGRAAGLIRRAWA
jgi:8-oxo-dGTP pyrophosphatase MutT (NUDIX family)